jgi:tetratricopeptide (TPR) repeat protein
VRYRANVSAPAEIAHADEALKSLVADCKASPDAESYRKLSIALTARGHALEAVAALDRALDIEPLSTDVRIERAMALVALDRHRSAYVELRKILAIDPTHRRAKRLLGRVYADAGLPDRAAGLLRMEERSTSSASVGVNPPRRTSIKEASISPPARTETLTQPNTRASAANGGQAYEREISSVFPDLARDLGLTEGSGRPIEVTQIIRRRVAPSRNQSTLLAIAGPIVDTAHWYEGESLAVEGTERSEFSSGDADESQETPILPINQLQAIDQTDQDATEVAFTYVRPLSENTDRSQRGAKSGNLDSSDVFRLSISMDVEADSDDIPSLGTAFRQHRWLLLGVLFLLVVSFAVFLLAHAQSQPTPTGYFVPSSGSRRGT